MKFPIGIQSFEDLRSEGYCYVDKTELIYKLTHEGKIYFLSRPRRFGKSLLLSTMENYFLGRKELFQGLAMEQLETDWTEYPVLHLDFNTGNYSQPGGLEDRLDSHLTRYERIYGRDPEVDKTYGDRLLGVIGRACEKTGRKVVVLVDEYDKPLLEVMDTELMNADRSRRLEDHNRDTLKEFYTALKSADKYLKFVFLTGVTKFAQVSVFSGFNSPEDISMTTTYEALCGITLDEMLSYFKEPIRELAEQENCSFDEMVQCLKKQYDGYHFSSRMTDVFNPFSLLNALKSKRLSNFWFSTGTPTYLVRLMAHNDIDIDELIAQDYDESSFIDARATPDNPLPILFQSGYLTIKDFNRRRYTYRLDFPNGEVRAGLIPLLIGSYMNVKANGVSEIKNLALDLSDALEFGDTDAFLLHMNTFLSSIPYDSHESFRYAGNTEKFFQMVFYLTMRLVGSNRLTTHVEQAQAKGRVDCIVEAPEYVYVIEFKLDGTAAEALQQIRDRRYADPYRTDPRKVVCIGASFSSQTKVIEDWGVEVS